MDNGEAIVQKESEVKRLNSELMILNSKYDQKVEDNEGMVGQLRFKDGKIEEHKVRIKDMLDEKNKFQELIDHLHHDIDETETTKMIIIDNNNQKLIELESNMQTREMESYQMKVVMHFLL